MSSSTLVVAAEHYDKKINYFTLHNERGQSILSSQLLYWRRLYPKDKSAIFGPIVRYSWVIDGRSFEILNPQSSVSMRELPDSSGFICFECGRTPDNCLLLDAYGKERMRLTVPWQLTKSQNPESARPPTSFASTSTPYVNPADGKEGLFGVTAWVENAGKYYFELDYHSGQFLWGREIMD